jgi:hypothetical protein
MVHVRHKYSASSPAPRFRGIHTFGFSLNGETYNVPTEHLRLGTLTSLTVRIVSGSVVILTLDLLIFTDRIAQSV